jgi:ABC-2 type transport system ATP-binding protein
VTAAISVRNVRHAYGSRQALDDVTFDVHAREIFGVLGPNGGGKTTLFRLLSTLLPVQSGEVHMLGIDAARDPAGVREIVGVTFQSPSLDRKLTVGENLTHQGRLYGLAGAELKKRVDALLDRFGLTDRRRELAETLSGGLQRRVEIAKGLLHNPQVLLLDEPSTGLDPGARIDLWRFLQALREVHSVTVVVTTHLMDEAERCDRLAILDRGKLVALGTPVELRSSIGGDCVTIQADNPESLAARIREKFQVEPRPLGQQLRVDVPRGHVFLEQVVEAFGGEIATISLGKPTLEDVFVVRTGHRFWDEESSKSEGRSSKH